MGQTEGADRACCEKHLWEEEMIRVLGAGTGSHAAMRWFESPPERWGWQRFCRCCW